LNLAHDTEGSGHPIVLVHAGIADRGMWAPPRWCSETSISQVRGRSPLHLTAGIDGARLVTITATAHLPSLERPDHCNEVVSGFLGEI